MELHRILVGVDGSTNSLAAVEWAAGLAQLTGAEVIAVHALGLLERLTPGSDAIPVESHQQDIRRAFEAEWCEPLERTGIPARRVLRYGTPVMSLLSLADEEDVDLIVLGSRGLGGFPQLLLGSTSTQIAQHSSRPVAIVPSPPPRAGG